MTGRCVCCGADASTTPMRAEHYRCEPGHCAEGGWTELVCRDGCDLTGAPTVTKAQHDAWRTKMRRRAGRRSDGLVEWPHRSRLHIAYRHRTVARRQEAAMARIRERNQRLRRRTR